MNEETTISNSDNEPGQSIGTTSKYRTQQSRRQQFLAKSRVFIASAVGTILEYYDFLIYATAASLVFPKVFFPHADGAYGVIASFGTLAVGYVARPLGGIVFGHFGDRLGRKSILLFTLSLMGLATFLIGAIPSESKIGIAAPTLLVALRVIQGVAVGGEWGGAALMAVEHANEKQRGLLGSSTQIGMAAGLLLSFGAFAALGPLSEDQFLTWGWRLPFFATALVVFLGMYVRMKIEESPVHLAEKTVNGTERRTSSRRSPLLTILKERPKQVLYGTFLYVGPFMAYSVATTMMIAYANDQHGIERQPLLNGMMIGTAGMLITIPAFAALSDRVGRRPVFVTSAVLTAGWVFAMFPLAISGNFLLIVIVYVISMTILNASANSPVPALLSEIFPTSSRYTGVSVCYQFGGTIAGGIGPLVATVFIRPGGAGTVAVSAMIAILCLVSAACAIALGETRSVDLYDA